MLVDLGKAGDLALAMMDAIIKMSDEAEELGGATTIAGVASLHRMQSTIQKHKARLRSELWKASRRAS